MCSARTFNTDSVCVCVRAEAGEECSRSRWFKRVINVKQFFKVQGDQRRGSGLGHVNESAAVIPKTRGSQAKKHENRQKKRSKN